MLMNIGLGSNAGVYSETGGPFYVMRDFFGALTAGFAKNTMGSGYGMMVLTVITMFVGLFVIIALAHKGVKGAVIIGMLAASILYWAGEAIFFGINPFASLASASWIPPFKDMASTTFFKFNFASLPKIGWFTIITLIVKQIDVKSFSVNFVKYLPTSNEIEIFENVGKIFPLSYEDDRAFLLHPAMVPYLSDGQIEELLQKNVLTDGESLSALAARGFGTEFPAQALPCDLPREETYGDAPEHGRINFIGDASACHELVPVGNAAEDGRFRPIAHAGGKIASALLKTARGGLWGVCANCLFRFTVNGARRAFLLDLAETLSGGFGARLLSAEQAVVVPRKDAAGRCTGVFVHSITISDSEELTFEIAAPASESFVWLTPDGDTTPCRFEKKDGRYHVRTPALRGYRSGLLLCEKARK